jgi:vacuolar protein sorting-associated protein VTA1
MTFDAAATFFHLVNIWGPPDQETQQKIKYAKWNAARIIKALKEGKDPNESNPKPEPVAQQPALDPEDPEVQGLEATTPAPLPPNPRNVTVEDAADHDVARDAAGVSLPHSPASTAPSDGLQLPGVPTHLSDPQPSLQPPGYFDDHSMPSPMSPPSHDPAGHQSSSHSNAPPKTWAPTPPPQAPHSSFAPPPSAPAAQGPQHRQAATPAAPPAAHLAKPAIPPPSASIPAAVPVTEVDEAAMVLAQKHAKWAISALNFEDVNTAITELRRALQSLGAN